MPINNNYRICTNCVMDNTDPLIVFDEKGICNRCNDFYKNILPKWNYGKDKEDELAKIVEKIKNKGKGKKYDCILGLSGGLDSSYMLHVAVRELGLRPLVFHVDAGWDAPFAKDNIDRLTKKLGVDLKIETINWDEVRDFQIAMFKSGVPHLDIPQDLAFVAVLDRYAVENDIKFILNGGNISTEVVVNPSSWGYWGTDMRHIKDILRRYGTIQMKTYPFTNIIKRKIIIPYIKGIRTVKLLNYMPYIKKDAESLLIREYGWQAYPQKHFESILTKFIEGYWLPERFGFDIRKAQFSSLILTGQMTREEALEKLAKKPIPKEEASELFEYVAAKLEISTQELRNYFEMPLKFYNDYKNQKAIIDFGAKILKFLKVDMLVRH